MIAKLTGSIELAPVLLLVEFSNAPAQELKPWRQAVIEPKGDAGFSLMVSIMFIMLRRCFPFLLDHIPEQRRHVGPAEIFYRANAGRRSDIDLGEPIADHVDAGE